jgi:hypothetical protein
LAEKRAEDLIGSKKDGRKGDALLDRPDMAHVNDRPDTLRVNDGPDTLHVNDRPDILHVNDRPDILHVNDRPDILRVNDGPEVLESEKGQDSKKKMNARCDPNNLQAERGGLKVKDSDFKTK